MNIIIKTLLILGLLWGQSLGAIKLLVNNYAKNDVNFHINNDNNYIVSPKPLNERGSNSNMVTIMYYQKITSLTATVNGKTVTINAPASFDQQRTALGVSIKDNNGNLVIEAGW